MRCPQVNSKAAPPLGGEQLCTPGPEARRRYAVLAHGKAPALVHRALPSIPCPSCVTLNKSFLLPVPQFPHVHEEVLHTDSYIIPSNSHTRFVNARHTVGLQHKPMVIVVTVSTLYPPGVGGGGATLPKDAPDGHQGLCLSPESSWKAVPIGS